MRGRIKRFIEDKGYGFITGEDGADYFFHISQVKDVVELKNWMIVEFDIVDGKRGKNAVNIRVIEQNNSPSKFITCGNTNIRLNNIKEYGIGQDALYFEKHFKQIVIRKEEKKIFGITYKTEEIYRYIPLPEWHLVVDGYHYPKMCDTNEEDLRNEVGLFPSDYDKYKDVSIKEFSQRDWIYIYCERESGYNGRVYFQGNEWKQVKIDTSKPLIGELIKREYRKYLYITTYQKENFKFIEDRVNFDVVEKYNEINAAMKYR